MTETTELKARREITFTTAGIPGQHATFTHDRTVWMAAPILKARALFDRAQAIANRAGHAHALLVRVVAKHPDLYLELAPALRVLDDAAGRVPWGTALDAEVAAEAAARAAAKKRRTPKFTH